MGIGFRFAMKGKNFPNKTVIERRYRNSLDPFVTVGNYYTEKIKTAEGQQHNKYYVYKKFNSVPVIMGLVAGVVIAIVVALAFNDLIIAFVGMLLGLAGGFFFKDDYVKIPDLPQSFFYDTGTVKLIRLMQTEDGMYYPMTFVDGQQRILVNERMDDGKIVETEKVISQTTVALENDHFVDLPFVIPNKVYSKEEEHIKEVHSDMAYYKKKSDLEKWIPLISVVVAGGIIGLMVIYGSQELTKMMSSMAGSNAASQQAMSAVAQNLTVVADKMSIVAERVAATCAK